MRRRQTGITGIETAAFLLIVATFAYVVAVAESNRTTENQARVPALPTSSELGEVALTRVPIRTRRDTGEIDSPTDGKEPTLETGAWAERRSARVLHEQRELAVCDCRDP